MLTVAAYILHWQPDQIEKMSLHRLAFYVSTVDQTLSSGGGK